MKDLILSRREIVRSELGERIELPGKQYVPYVAVAGIIFAFATSAPWVAVGLLLVGAHTVLPVKVKDSQLPARERRMHSLLAEDDGSDRTLEDVIHDALALDQELARSVAEFIYNNARRDYQGDWVIEWKGEEYLVCDFFQGSFEHQYNARDRKATEQKIEAESAAGLPQRTIAPPIGANTKLNAVPIAAAAIADVSIAPPVTVGDAPKSVEQLAIEFPAWFQDWGKELVQKTEEYTRIPFNTLQRVWMKDNEGQTISVFTQVLQRNLPGGATIEDGFVYLKKTSAKDKHIGVEVTPKTPKTTIADRCLTQLKDKGETDAQAFVDSFGEEKPEAIAALKTLLIEKKVRVTNRSVYLV